MSMNDTYQPINCDDYDNLELACQHHLMLTLELKDGEKLQAKASDLVSRKNVGYGGGKRILIDFRRMRRLMRLIRLSLN